MYEEFNGNLSKFANSGNLRQLLESKDLDSRLVTKIVDRCLR